MQGAKRNANQSSALYSLRVVNGRGAAEIPRGSSDLAKSRLNLAVGTTWSLDVAHIVVHVPVRLQPAPLSVVIQCYGF